MQGHRVTYGDTNFNKITDIFNSTPRQSSSEAGEAAEVEQPYHIQVLCSATKLKPRGSLGTPTSLPDLIVPPQPKDTAWADTSPRLGAGAGNQDMGRDAAAANMGMFEQEAKPHLNK